MNRPSFWLAAICTLATPSWSQQQNYVPDHTASYAPPEVLDPHPAQTLTVFLPRTCPPEDTGLYPVLLYSPASAFATTQTTLAAFAAGSVATFEDGLGEFEPLTEIEDGLPDGGGGPVITLTGTGTYLCVGSCPPPTSAPSAPTQPSPLFLTEALNSGWAVVTVGTTGFNSWPTCEEDQDCNLWYEPGTAQWDDFSLFYGEKEFLWARQWVGEHGAGQMLDTDRVVVCGTSTGAIYASFLAFGPNRAWDGSHSSQAQQDTRVAAVVAFEPNTWIKGLSPALPGVHWPSSSNALSICTPGSGGCNGGGTCFNRRASTLGSGNPVATGLLEESSISRWVREIEDASELSTPAFIAAGDGLVTTDFARDAEDYPEDYERYWCDPDPEGEDPCENGLTLGDPLLAFPSSGPPLRLHDSWYAINFALDLEMLDAATGTTFHEENSRLFLQDGHTWSNLPPHLSVGGMVPPDTAADVLLLDDTYANHGNLQSIDNPDLVPQVITWMDEVLGIEHPGSTAFRNPALVGPSSVPNVNPALYTLDDVRQGLSTKVTIDLSNSDYELASVLVFTDAYAPGTELVLSGGQALLCDLGSYLFSLPFAQKSSSTGKVTLQLGPATPACGVTFTTQGVLVDFPKTMPFALTNAQDVTVLP